MRTVMVVCDGADGMVWFVPIPEPYQAGNGPFRGSYPPVGFGVDEADLFWRDQWHDWRAVQEAYLSVTL
jgi:hypothetical protein